MYVYVWNKNYTGTDTHTHPHTRTHTHIHLREGYSLLSVCRSHTPKTTPCTFLRRRVRGTAHGAHPQEGSLFQMQIMPEEASIVGSKGGEMTVSCPTSNRSRCEPVEFGRGRPQGQNNPIGTWRWISSRHATSPGNSPTSARCQQRRPALALPKITRHPPSKHMPVDHVNVLPNFLLVVLAVVEWWWYGWWWLVRI